MSLDLISKVNDRFISAIAFHRAQRDLFVFLSLEGFSQLHSYQIIVESKMQENLKTFIIKTYHHLPSDSASKAFYIGIKKSRLDLTPDYAWKENTNSFKQYRAWESETLSIYEDIAQQLNKSGDLIGYNYIKNIALEVHKELIKVSDMIIAYSAIEWDLSQIKSEQDTLLERYIYLTSQIYPEVKPHHFNSLVD